MALARQRKPQICNEVLHNLNAPPSQAKIDPEDYK
jgi:hypothetical protein